MNNKTKLISLREELKKAIDDANYEIKHSVEMTATEIEEMLKELEAIKQLTLVEIAGLEAKLRRLSILQDA